MIAKSRTGIADVLSALTDAQSVLCTAGDPNAYFVALYRATTAKCLWLESAITDPAHPDHRRHRHLDVRLIRDIVVHFEPLYAVAVERYRAGRLAPDNPWRRVLDHAGDGSPASVLLLGAHTHIGFDLPVVLASDLPGGTPLFDAEDPRQAQTHAALNRLFMNELPRIAGNVREVETCLARRRRPNVGGCAHWLYAERARSLATPLLRWLLTLARLEARRNAARLRSGELDVTRLGRLIDARNRRFLAGWRAAGRSRSQRVGPRGASAATP